MTFSLYSLRFYLRARDVVRFPQGKAGNTLRGAFGLAIQRIPSEAYAQIFEPKSSGTGPSGLADPPRPFVFRSRSLDGQTFAPGDDVIIDINLFDTRSTTVEYFIDAIREMASSGLGPERGTLDLVDVPNPELVILPLSPLSDAPRSVEVQFLTPTELKGADLDHAPDFNILFSRARDRISTLRALYGPGPLDIDFKAMAARAAEVTLVRSRINRVAVNRRSSRTGQTHPIGGFTGCAEYSGSLAEFLPYLYAARWTGIGRQTVWGNGEIEVTPIP